MKTVLSDMLNSKIDKDTPKFVIPLTEPKTIKQALGHPKYHKGNAT